MQLKVFISCMKFLFLKQAINISCVILPNVFKRKGSMKTRIEALAHVKVSDKDRMKFINQLPFSEISEWINASEELLIEFNDKLSATEKSYHNYKKTWLAFFGLHGGERFYWISQISHLEGCRNNLKEFISFLNFRNSQFNEQSIKENKNSNNYFDTLLVNPNTPTDMFDKILKNNYKALALKYHPDKPGGSENKFKEIQEAFECLSDPTKRCIYQESVAINQKPMRFGNSKT